MQQEDSRKKIEADIASKQSSYDKLQLECDDVWDKLTTRVYSTLEVFYDLTNDIKSDEYENVCLEIRSKCATVLSEINNTNKSLTILQKKCIDELKVLRQTEVLYLLDNINALKKQVAQSKVSDERESNLA